MSTEMESGMARHTAKKFWGGDDRGVCLQVTASGPLEVRVTASEQMQEEGFIVVDMVEASKLCQVLARFVRDEAMRRQALLRAELDRLQTASKTVFHEVVSLSPDLFQGPELAVDFVSRFCPVVERRG